MMQIVLIAFVDTAILCLKLWNAISIIVHVTKLVFFSLRENFGEAFGRQLDELRKQSSKEKGQNVIDLYECDCWKKYKTEDFVKQHLCQSFRYKVPLREEFFFGKYRVWKSFSLCSMRF